MDKKLSIKIQFMFVMMVMGINHGGPDDFRVPVDRDPLGRVNSVTIGKRPVVTDAYDKGLIVPNFEGRVPESPFRALVPKPSTASSSTDFRPSELPAITEEEPQSAAAAATDSPVRTRGAVQSSVVLSEPAEPRRSSASHVSAKERMMELIISIARDFVDGEEDVRALIEAGASPEFTKDAINAYRDIIRNGDRFSLDYSTLPLRVRDSSTALIHEVYRLLQAQDKMELRAAFGAWSRFAKESATEKAHQDEVALLKQKLSDAEARAQAEATAKFYSQEDDKASEHAAKVVEQIASSRKSRGSEQSEADERIAAMEEMMRQQAAAMEAMQAQMQAVLDRNAMLEAQLSQAREQAAAPSEARKSLEQAGKILHTELAEARAREAELAEQQVAGAGSSRRQDVETPVAEAQNQVPEPQAENPGLFGHLKNWAEAMIAPKNKETIKKDIATRREAQEERAKAQEERAKALYEIKRQEEIKIRLDRLDRLMRGKVETQKASALEALKAYEKPVPQAPETPAPSRTRAVLRRAGEGALGAAKAVAGTVIDRLAAPFVVKEQGQWKTPKGSPQIPVGTPTPEDRRQIASSPTPLRLRSAASATAATSAIPMPKGIRLRDEMNRLKRSSDASTAATGSAEPRRSVTPTPRESASSSSLSGDPLHSPSPVRMMAAASAGSYVTRGEFEALQQALHGIAQHTNGIAQHAYEISLQVKEMHNIISPRLPVPLPHHGGARPAIHAEEEPKPQAETRHGPHLEYDVMDFPELFAQRAKQQGTSHQ